MKYKLIALAAAAAVLFAGAWALGSWTSSSGFVWNLSGGGRWLFPLVGIAALVDSVNPCAFSILLLTIAFLFSIGKLRSKILAIGALYIFGIFVAYMLIGLGLLQTLHLFDTPHFMGRAGAVLLVVLGVINIISEFFPSFPIRLQIPASAHRAIAVLAEKGSLASAFFLGGLVGICEFPCTGGPYLMVLGLLRDNATYLAGFGYLLFYNLVFILPLAVMLGIASDSSLLQAVQNWQKKERKWMRAGSGVAMVLLGGLIFFI